MEDVFRFSFVRPAFVAEDANVVALERTTKLQSELASARAGVDPRANMMAIAKKYAAPKVARDYSDLKLGPKWAELADLLGAADPPTRDQAIARIQTIFGKAPDGASTDPAFIADDNEAADAIVLVKMLAAEQPAGFGVMPTVVRLAELVRSLARDGAAAPADSLTWTIVVPPKVFPIPPAAVKGTPPPPPPSTQVPDLKAKIAATQAALEEIMSIEATTATIEDAFATTPPVVLAHSSAAASVPVDSPTSLRRADAFALAPAVASSLSSGTTAVLKARALDVTKLSVDRIANSLARAVNNDTRQLAQLSPNAHKYIHLVGTTPIPVAPSGPMFGPGPTPPSPMPWTVPTTYGSISSVGMSDLLVVKQQLKRYERTDIAHIENVMKGESMKREHVTSTTTEEFSLTQSTTTSETEQDLESTDRFEISRQVTQTLAEAASMQAGLTMSGSYGPTVSFTSNVQGSVQEQKSEASTQATKYSKDVTQKTAKKVSETVMQQHSLKVTTNVTDTATHGFENSNGAEHVVGIYQWLDKVYEAQVYNYGLRALFDFMVSEPAAVAIAAMKGQFAQATELRKPTDFTVTPAMIDETNYTGYLLEWEASGANPPPDPYVTVTKTFKAGPDDANAPTRGFYVDVADIPIADGYRAVYVTASRLFNIWDVGAEAYVDIVVGGTGKKMVNNGGWTWNATLAGEVGALSVAIKTLNTSVYAVEIEIRCERTPRAMDKWRHEVYNILLAAYQKQLSDYENKLAALQARVGVEISGRNPTANRMLEMTELKRACIAILTAQNFNGFGSIVPGANGLPDLDFAKQELEGPYIRFFEQAFEWENLTYVFYPYYWGDRATWLERINYDDVDPTFAAFLKAGSARVVAPVRPGFECAVDHFLHTGEVWKGRGLPSIGQDLYVPIIEELRESLGAPGNEVPQGDPWEVRVATSLVLLRPDASLPVWTKNEDGSWTES